MLYEILKKMEKRPGMFPCENIEAIFTYIHGYSDALFVHNIKDSDY